MKFISKKILVDIIAGLSLIFLVGSIIFVSLKEEKTNQNLPQEATSFSFKNLEGRSFNMVQFQGRVVLINIWATWCPPCIEELPSLLKLARIFPEQLVVVAVSSESATIIEEFIKSFKSVPENLIFSSHPDAMEIFSPTAIPETYIIDKKSQMVSVILGPQHWDSLEWQNKIKAIFKGE